MISSNLASKHPRGIERKSTLPRRRSERIRKAGTRVVETVPNGHPTPPPSKLRKRRREEEQEKDRGTDQPTEATSLQKRQRPTTSSHRSPYEPQATTSLEQNHTSHIAHWAQQGQVWPGDFFEVKEMLARRRSVASLRRKRSEESLGTSVTPSDLPTNDAPYRHPNYHFLLEREAGSFLDEYEQGITQASESFCQLLLDSDQAIPKDTIFRDDIFGRVCRRLRGKNEARIFKDCTPLIVPGVETHELVRANPNLDVAVESVNEGWSCSNPITKPRPQPDYAVGFSRDAFSDDQLQRLAPYLADPSSTSHIMGTYYMLFPFLTCEVKSGGSAGLDIADRQNLHSMTLALRGIVELFRLVHRAAELHRKILAYSISHDYRTVRIYGHYPVIEGGKTTYWRYPIRQYDITERKGVEKWTGYKFTKNVYDLWMPKLFEMITSI
ncbi:MAG: hypothetical protein Q9224_006632, partial [Gallowayella concinna]